jgi:hypothetical protein
MPSFLWSLINEVPHEVFHELTGLVQVFASSIIVDQSSRKASNDQRVGPEQPREAAQRNRCLLTSCHLLRLPPSFIHFS